MVNYVITGANGYIGSQFVKQLSKNNIVYSVVRNGCKQLKIENENTVKVEYDGTEESLKEAISKADYVIHLGAMYSTQDDENTINKLIDDNIKFSSILFSTAKKYNSRLPIVVASTFSAFNLYGKYSPNSFYDATKYCVEMIAEYYKNDVNILCCRFPDTYGENDCRNKIHNLLLNHDKTQTFKFKSNPKQEIQYLHIDDILLAIQQIFSDYKYNIGKVLKFDLFKFAHRVPLSELAELFGVTKYTFDDNVDKMFLPYGTLEVEKLEREYDYSFRFQTKFTNLETMVETLTKYNNK